MTDEKKEGDKGDAIDGVEQMDSIRPERVAVITVHGVGDPVLGDTARHIVTLLQRRQGGALGSKYSPFEESSIDIPVTAIVIPKRVAVKDDIAFTIHALEMVDATDQVGCYRTVKFAGTRMDPATNTTVSPSAGTCHVHTPGKRTFQMQRIEPAHQYQIRFTSQAWEGRTHWSLKF